MVMRMRRQTTLGEVDAPAIEKLAAGSDSDEHRRLPLLGDADRRDSLRLLLRHVFSRRVFSRHVPSRPDEQQTDPCIPSRSKFIVADLAARRYT